MSDFDIFWGVYPRHIDKSMVKSKFEAITNGGIQLRRLDHEGNHEKWFAQATADEVIAGAKAYAFTRSDEDKKFIKHPSTWLNHGCWMDFENVQELAHKYDERAEKRKAAQLKHSLRIVS